MKEALVIIYNKIIDVKQHTLVKNRIFNVLRALLLVFILSSFTETKHHVSRKIIRKNLKINELDQNIVYDRKLDPCTYPLINTCFCWLF